VVLRFKITQTIARRQPNKEKINRNVCKVRGKRLTRHREGETMARSPNSSNKKYINNDYQITTIRETMQDDDKLDAAKVKLNKNAIKMHSIFCSEKGGGGSRWE